jgi:N-acyl homoserine lactone hydrolase
MFPTVSNQFLLHNQSIKIHAISTGAVAVKTKFRAGQGKGTIAKINFLLDKNFTEWMPIWVWVIEHPEGVFVIDTGENMHVNDSQYFKSSGWFNNWLNTTQFRFKVNRTDELDYQLHNLGIAESDLKAIILTHLHLDHIDGLKFFPNTPVIVSSEEWKKPYGLLPKLLPAQFKPQIVDCNTPLTDFGLAHPLTKKQDLWLVPTPGHTWGHCSVLFKGDDCQILFAGDVTYLQSQLIENKFAGGNVDDRQMQATYQKIRQYAQKHPLIYLPSHDAEAANRLFNQEVLFNV